MPVDARLNKTRNSTNQKPQIPNNDHSKEKKTDLSNQAATHIKDGQIK